MNTSCAISKLLSQALFNPNAAHEVGPQSFTALFICAKNRFAQTLLSVYSLLKYHPHTSIVLVLCDETNDLESARSFLPEKSHLIQAKDIGIPHFREMAFQYSIYELCCAIKPFALQYAWSLFPDHTKLLYCDGDLLFFSPLSEALEALGETPIVMTPHHLYRPVPHRSEIYPSEMLFGTYNGGFLGFSNTSEARNCLEWFFRATHRHGFIDRANNEFLDQKWLDVIPTLWKDTQILNHPGYNISWWNLHERRFEAGPREYTVNHLPARFFHLSSFNRTLGAPLVHHFYFNEREIKNTAIPFADPYRKALQSLLAAPQMPSWEAPYAYDYFHNGRPIPFYIKRGFANAHPWPLLKDPFDPKNYWTLRAQFRPLLFHIWRRTLEKITQS